MIFILLPLGFRAKELTYCGLLGVLILLLNNSIKISNIKVILIFLGITFVGTFFSIFNHQEFSMFQFFRGLIFPILTITLLEAKFKPSFFIRLEKLIPMITIGGCTSASIYFMMGSDGYNSTLNIPYDFSEYKRFYIYPFYFFFILFFDSVNKSNNNVHLLYAFLLILSGSKLILLLIFLTYSYKYLYKNLTLNNFLYLIGIIFLLGYVSTLSEIFDRFVDLYLHGDPWRITEPIAALKRLLNPIKFFIGNGSGIPYWAGEPINSIFQTNYRLLQNSMYDVHNGIVNLWLKFGIPLGTFFLYKLYKILPMIPNKNFLFFMLITLILFSHGPIQTVESLGLVLGIRLLIFKNNLLAIDK